MKLQENNNIPFAAIQQHTTVPATRAGFVSLLKSQKNPKENIQLLQYNVKGKREIFFSSWFAEKCEAEWVAEDSKTSAALSTVTL